MSHFAQIDENNVVQQVLVIEQAEVDTGNWGDPASWVQTSYNTYGSVYFIPNSSPPTPDPDQSKAFRKNYAGIGYTWDGVGFAAPQPYPSWTKDSFTYSWVAPVPFPAQPWPEGVIGYEWDESTLSWIPIYQLPKEQP